MAEPGTPSDDLLRIGQEINEEKDERTLWFRLLWVSDEGNANERTACNFLLLGLFLVDRDSDKHLVADSDAPRSYRCLLSLLRRACEIIRPLTTGIEANQEMMADMLVDLLYADSQAELREWRNWITEVQADVRQKSDTKIDTAISKLRPKEREAYFMLCDHGPLTGKVLASRIHVSASYLRRHILNALRPLGLVNPRDGTGYRIEGM